MKKKTIIFLTLLATVLLVSCKTGHSMGSYEMAQMRSAEVMDCVSNKDAEGFRELFCPYMKDNRPSLDDEIEKFLAFIDGEIVSHAEPDGAKGGGYTRSDGVSEQKLTGKIENITTDTGKHYRISLSSFSVNKDSPELVGLMAIKIFDVDTLDPENGYPEGGTYSIYYKDEPE